MDVGEKWYCINIYARPSTKELAESIRRKARELYYKYLDKTKNVMLAGDFNCLES